MAKLDRKLLKIFGVDGASTNFGKFGSLKAGSPTTTKDIDTIQALSAYLNGWTDAVIGANRVPTLEDTNALNYLNSYMMKYLYQEGIPEWIATETYYIDSICKVGNTIYVSKVNDNIGNNPSGDTTNWGNILNFTGKLVAPSFEGTHLGTMQRIYSNTLSSPTTSITITGLNGNVDYEYRLAVHNDDFTSGAGHNFYLQFNGDTDNNYSFYSLGDTLNSSQNKILVSNGNGNSVSAFEIIIYAKTTYEFQGNRLINSRSGFASNTDTLLPPDIIQGMWLNKTSNITSITLFSNATNAFGVGSTIELYARR